MTANILGLEKLILEQVKLYPEFQKIVLLNQSFECETKYRS
jgi:hypothetical protein